jgi:cytochrome c oxidase assembly protein subunit 11
MSAQPPPSPHQRRRMTITAAVAAAAVLGMTGMAFAAVPLYRAFCQATGYGGTTQRARTAPGRVLAETVEVSFDTNVATDLPIEFKPLQGAQTLHLGETGLAYFRIKNNSDHPVTAVATYNVAPHKVGIYFEKLECFCFQPRTLQPGQSMDAPVVYFVNPDMARDPETREVRQIVLSYTYFHSVDQAQAALERAGTATP